MTSKPHQRVATAVVVGTVMIVSLGRGATPTETVGEQARRPFAEELSDDSGLPDYVGYALANNPGLRASRLRWDAARRAVGRADALPDATVTYGLFLEEVETRVGPQEHKFEVRQPIPWLGKLIARRAVARETAAMAGQELEMERRRLAFRVTAAYADLYYLGKAIAITERTVQLMTDLERVARARYKTGGTRHASVIRAQLELGRLEDGLRSLRDRRRPAVARLNALLGRETTRPIPWPASLPPRGGALDHDAVLSLVAMSPELKALGHGVDRAEASIRLARNGFAPDLGLGAAYIETAGAIVPGVADSGKDPILAMVTVSVPWDLGTRIATLKEAGARRDAALARRTDRRRALHAEVEGLVYRLRDADRQTELYGQALIPKARESLAVTVQSFEAGTEDFLALIDAERLLLDFELAHEKARAERVRRLADLERIVGRRLLAQATKEPGTKESRE